MKLIRCRDAVVLLSGVLSVGAVQAQAVSAQEGAKAEAPIPAITDWSSRSIIYGKPKLPEEFARTAAGDAELERKYRDPRYVAAVLERVESEMPSLAPRSAGTTGKMSATSDRRRGHGSGDDSSTDESSIHRDWSNILGNNTSGLGSPGTFPAKYRFDITAPVSAANCAQDFVVYTTAATGATQAAGAEETRTGSSMTGGAPSGSITIGSGPRAITLTASGSPTTNLQFSTAGDATIQAASLAAAVNVWQQQTGIRATSSGANITFHRLGNGNTGLIPVTSNGPMTNFTLGVTEGNGGGSSGQPTIVAFNQLYNTTCNPTRSNTNAPNVMWAYNTGAAITETSPVLSYYDNGAQVAFVQRVASTNPDQLQLVLLKWRLNDGTAVNPVALTSVANTAYRACSAPCMTVFTLPTSNTDDAPTFSSPYVDYASDTLWVGDGNGRLHKFNNVFKAGPINPTQAGAGSGFPAVVAAAGTKLSPPVFDDVYVWVGSSSNNANDDSGKMHRVLNSDGQITESAKLVPNATSGLIALPILDWARNRLYTTAFSIAYPGTNLPGCNSSGDTAGNFCRAVLQFNTSTFTTTQTPAVAYAGRGTYDNTGARKQWNGAFDRSFYNTGTGNLYVCGGSQTRTRHNTLWRIPLTFNAVTGNTTMGTPVAGAQIGTHDLPDTASTAQNPISTYDCSPVTVVNYGSTSRLYASVPGTGNLFSTAPQCGATADATGQCIYMFDLNDLNGSGTGTPVWGNNNSPSAALLVPGGTSGIIIDNTSGTAGASQVYFSQTGFSGTGGSSSAPALPGNAVQATQAGLN